MTKAIELLKREEVSCSREIDNLTRRIEQTKEELQLLHDQRFHTSEELRDIRLALAKLDEADILPMRLEGSD